MTRNLQLMRDAKASLRGKWSAAALATLIFTIIIIIASSVFPGIGGIFFVGSHLTPSSLADLPVGFTISRFSFSGLGVSIIGGPMILGYIFYLKAIRSGHSPKMEVLFSGFKDFLRAFLGYLLVGIFTFLWMLLLIVPGIVMAFAYSMTMYIIADDPEISAMDAIRRSRDMMRGYKWKYVGLQLHFFGWGILCVLTCGILAFWIQPYMTMANLNFYNDVKAEWEARK